MNEHPSPAASLTDDQRASLNQILAPLVAHRAENLRHPMFWDTLLMVALERLFWLDADRDRLARRVTELERTISDAYAAMTVPPHTWRHWTHGRLTHEEWDAFQAVARDIWERDRVVLDGESAPPNAAATGEGR